MHTKTELCDQIIRSLRDEPHKWHWDDGRDTWIAHRCGLKLWVWSGAMRVYQPAKIEFRFFNRCRLRRAFRHWVLVYGRGLILREENQTIAWAVETLIASRGAV
jgi:hypothetical protein